MSQKEKVMRYMQEYGSISPVEAYRDLGCMRLSARISELRGDGHMIKAEFEHAKNRFGDPICFVRYSLG